MIHELFERMRANRDAVISGDYNTSAIDCSSGLSKNCTGTAACTGAEIAAYDLFTVQCGEGSASATNSGAGSQLLDGSFEVDCTGTNCTVSFAWKERVTEQGLETTDADDNTIELTEESQVMSIDAVL
jgi:hypothetical protein